MRVAHLPFELGPRHEGRDRVDDDDVDGIAAHQHLGDLEGLLSEVGLRDEQVVDVDTQPAGVLRVECVLGVDEGGYAALLLRLADGGQRQCRLARRLRAVDLDDTPAREAADADGGIDGDRSRGDGGDRHRLPLPEPHDRALAELALDLGEGVVDRLDSFVGRLCHESAPRGVYYSLVDGAPGDPAHRSDGHRERQFLETVSWVRICRSRRRTPPRTPSRSASRAWRSGAGWSCGRTNRWPPTRR